VTAVTSLHGIDAVVVGASAGGVEALSVLLPGLPSDMRAAVFVVLHVPRERPSLLVEVLQPWCNVAVREAFGKEPVEPATVYVAPPDYHLLIDCGPALALSADDLVNYSRPSVDVLFESAADIYKERLLGIILTGASHDGAAGLEAVSAAGGLTIVQDPDSAQVRTMAEAAVKRRPPDLVLPLPAIARLLGTLNRAADRQPGRAET
jgi:two-component system, chemotaxis family, protein-glutamate methylesterase/glutaminase